MTTACYVWQNQAFCCVRLAERWAAYVRPNGDTVAFPGTKQAPAVAAALAPLEGQALCCIKCGRKYTVSTTLNDRQTVARVTLTPSEG